MSPDANTKYLLFITLLKIHNITMKQENVNTTIYLQMMKVRFRKFKELIQSYTTGKVQRY